jgi:hypothetical protein
MASCDFLALQFSGRLHLRLKAYSGVLKCDRFLAIAVYRMTKRLSVIGIDRKPVAGAADRDVELVSIHKLDGADRIGAILEKQNLVREIAIAKDRYDAIAREYLGAYEADQRVLVVSPANDERRHLNTAICDLLKQRGHVAAEGQDQTILVNRSLTAAQRAFARNYEVGDIVRYRRGSKKLALPRGGCASVESIDRKTNRRPENKPNYRPGRRSANRRVQSKAAIRGRSLSP